jgi:hypothetical protein
MDATAAERQRRYRAHKAGNHTLCDPDRDCGDDVTPPVTRHPPLRGRGKRLWADLGGDSLAGGRRVLLEEACRIADRLDKLDALLSGDATSWVELVESKGDPDRQEVVIDKALAEARQQAVALKALISELRQEAAPKPVAEPPAAKGVSNVLSLADEVARRREATAG